MRTITRLAERYLRIRETRMEPSSAMGIALEKARLELPSSGGDSNHAEERNIEYARLIYLFERSLTERERACVFFRIARQPHSTACSPLSRVDDADENNQITVRCQCGAVEYRERPVREGDLKTTVREGDESIHETWSGARVVGRRKDEHGEPMNGWVIVEEVYPVNPTQRQVAEHMKISVRTVARELSSAEDKAILAQVME